MTIKLIITFWRLAKEFKLRSNEDLRTAKNILNLINLNCPFLIKYLDLHYDKEMKSIFVFIDYYDVSDFRIRN